MNQIIGIILLLALASGVAAQPVADAGSDQHVSSGTLVTLDGSGSTGGDNLTYRWTEGSTVLSDGAAASFSYVFSSGTHTITLNVTDDTGAGTDTVVVRVNQPLVANAGSDQVVSPGTSVRLDASGSSGSSISYVWKEDGVNISTKRSFRKTYSSAGRHEITLTVTDDLGDQDNDCVTILVLSRGDLNHDGTITPTDAAIALQMAVSGECAAGASVDSRATSQAAVGNVGIAPFLQFAPLAQASSLTATDAVCNVTLDARYGDAKAQEKTAVITLKNTGNMSITVYQPALSSPESGIALTALGTYPISLAPDRSKDLWIKVCMAGDVVEGAYIATAYFSDCVAIITINVRCLTRYYNPDCDVADVSGDGKVTSLDALMILQMAARDKTPPEITLVNNSIGVYDNITISFSETIDISTLYISVIGPYHGMVSGSIICDDDMKGALFDPDNPLQIGAHSVHVKCRDLSDNLAEQEFVLMAVGEDEPEPNTTTKIVINELMPDPIGRDHGNETTELYNCGNESADLSGWVIKNEDGDTYEIPVGTIIDTHGYYLTPEIQLDNSGGHVVLYHDGEEVDRSIAYTHSTEGLSWQRRTDGLDTNNDGDWTEA